MQDTCLCNMKYLRPQSTVKLENNILDPSKVMKASSRDAACHPSSLIYIFKKLWKTSSGIEKKADDRVIIVNSEEVYLNRLYIMES